MEDGNCQKNVDGFRNQLCKNKFSPLLLYYLVSRWLNNPPAEPVVGTLRIVVINRADHCALVPYHFPPGYTCLGGYNMITGATFDNRLHKTFPADLERYLVASLYLLHHSYIVICYFPCQTLSQCCHAKFTWTICGYIRKCGFSSS